MTKGHSKHCDKAYHKDYYKDCHKDYDHDYDKDNEKAKRKIEFECTLTSGYEAEFKTSVTLLKSLREVESQLLILITTLDINLGELSVEVQAELPQLIEQIKEIKYRISQSIAQSVMFEESVTFKFESNKFDECEYQHFKNWLSCVDSIKAKRRQWIQDASDSLESANSLIAKANKHVPSA